jgi:hypothetical protein
MPDPNTEYRYFNRGKKSGVASTAIKLIVPMEALE